MRIGRPARFGEASVQIGYGLQRGQTELTYETQPRMRKAGLSIAGVGPDSLEEGVTTVAPRTLLVEGPAGCVGDSGGPLVAAATGALLGVYSLQQGDDCASSGVRNFLEHVPPFERLIADAFAAAGTEPLLEPELTEGTGGAAGASSVEESGRGGEGAEPASSGGGPSKRRDSGCAFGNHQERASGACAGLLMLGVLWRRLSDGRRAGRRPSSAFPRV
jgi:hypothetical protein